MVSISAAEWRNYHSGTTWTINGLHAVAETSCCAHVVGLDARSCLIVAGGLHSPVFGRSSSGLHLRWTCRTSMLVACNISIFVNILST